MSGGIWVCSSPRDTRLIFKVASEWFDDLSLEDMLIQNIRKNDVGVQMNRDQFPPSIYLQKSAKDKDKILADIFIANGFIVVSGRSAKIIQDFDVGKLKLFKVPVFQSDRVTPLEGEWFFLNYGNVKEAFVPEASRDVEPVGVTNVWHMPISPQDGDVAVESCALGGVDIWVDPKCRKVFFVKEALFRAIQAQNLRGFWFTKCTIL